MYKSDSNETKNGMNKSKQQKSALHNVEILQKVRNSVIKLLDD